MQLLDKAIILAELVIAIYAYFLLVLSLFLLLGWWRKTFAKFLDNLPDKLKNKDNDI